LLLARAAGGRQRDQERNQEFGNPHGDESGPRGGKLRPD
jgi:hypothetical protein